MSEARILHLSSGARNARGITVIIDVFRAVTTACQLIENGAARILPVAGLDEARTFRQRFPHFLLVGERNGIKLPDADYGNSPAEVAQADFTGTTVILTTSAGTKGFAAAVNADQLLGGCLANADALVRYLGQFTLPEISLVCMGFRDQRPTDEDNLCAALVRDGLMGKGLSQAEVRKILRNSPDAKKFFDPQQTWASEEDFSRCTQLGQFDFVLRLELQPEGFQALVPVPV